MQFEYTITKEDKNKILKNNFFNKKFLKFYIILLFGTFLFYSIITLISVGFDFTKPIFFKQIYDNILISIFSIFFYFMIFIIINKKILKNSIDEQFEFIFSDDKIILKTNLLNQEFLYSFFDNYLVDGKILKLKKYNQSGINILLYKLTDSQREELISIISSKIPLKK